MRAASFLLALIAARTAHATETLVDDFESASAPSAWMFSNGSEFPGATGELTTGPGHTGKGAHLAFDLTAGGNYVSTTRMLAQPLTAAAVAYWVKSAGNIHVVLRVMDSSNQVLQYMASRPLEATDAAGWYRQVVALDAPSSYFGGANDGSLHQPIAAISILAANPIERAAGAIDVDDVSVLTALEPALDPSAPSFVAAPASSADLASRLAVNVHFTKDDRALDIAREAGFTAVRMDLGWSAIEHTKGSYDFSAHDELVASLASRSMRLHLILDYFNDLYPNAASSDFAGTTVPAFAAMAKATAQHFAGKNVSYEVWNEPNGASFWPPAPDAARYATLAAAAISAVHAGDAAARVSTAGVSGFDFSFVRGYLTNGGAAAADAIGVHPYRMNAPESLIDDLIWMRAIVADALSPAPPLWDTEWGYSSAWYGNGHDAATRKTQAVYAVRELLSAWSVGFPLVVYYDLRDDGSDPTNGEHNFGLVQNDYTDKPAIQAVRALSSVAKGRTFTGFIPMAPTSLHALRLDGGDDVLIALWSDAKDSTITVSLAGHPTATDMIGADVAVASGTVTVREADGPIYVRYAGAESDADGGVATSSGGAGRGSAGDDHAAAGASGAAPSGAKSGVDAGAGKPEGDRRPKGASGNPGCGCRVAQGRVERRPLDWIALLVALLGWRRFARRLRGSDARVG